MGNTHGIKLVDKPKITMEDIPNYEKINEFNFYDKKNQKMYLKMVESLYKAINKKQATVSILIRTVKFLYHEKMIKLNQESLQRYLTNDQKSVIAKFTEDLEEKGYPFRYQYNYEIDIHNAFSEDSIEYKLYITITLTKS